jgi:hypothetical protein
MNAWITASLHSSIELFFFFYSFSFILLYVHTMFGSFLSPSSCPLPYLPCPPIELFIEYDSHKICHSKIYVYSVTFSCATITTS